MNKEKFVSLIKEVVRDAAIEDTILNVEDPPGRRVSDEEKQLSEWFKNLKDVDQKNMQTIVSKAVDEAIFGFFCVLDGVRAIEDGEDKGDLILNYVSTDQRKVLNGLDTINLHDLYNAEE